MQAPGSGKCQTAWFWTYARDERPWAGDASPAAWYRFSVDRKGIRTFDHLKNFTARAVFTRWPAWRKFVNVHKAQGSAIAEEAIRRIAELYAVEKEAHGSPPDERMRLGQTKAKPVLYDLDAWLGAQLTRIKRLRPYLDHGILKVDNNAAERGMRSIAIGRKNWIFAGSKQGGRSAAIAYTLIETAKLNHIDPQAWRAYKFGHADRLDFRHFPRSILPL